MRLVGIFLIAACHYGAVPPPSPSCTAVAEHVGQLMRERPRAASVRDVVATRCASDIWRDDARACMLATTSLDKPQHCKARLTTAQRGAFERDLAALTVGAKVTRTPEACQVYGQLLSRLDGCAAIPSGMRDVLSKTFRDHLRRAEGNPSGLGARCKLMLDDLRQATGAACGF